MTLYFSCTIELFQKQLFAAFKTNFSANWISLSKAQTYNADSSSIYSSLV